MDDIPDVRVFGYIYEVEDSFTFRLHSVIDYKGKRFEIVIRTDTQYAICEVSKENLKPIGNLIYVDKTKLHKEILRKDSKAIESELIPYLQ